jgi:hypothetical protein
MTVRSRARQPTDFARPAVARVFDHLLGGSDNCADRLLQAAPGAGRPETGRPRRAGAAVCAVVLALLHTAAGYLAFLAYAAGIASPWERDAAAHSGFAAVLALMVVLVSAPLTWASVRTGRLRGWWYALPAVLAAAALLRLTLLAPEQHL